MLAEAYPEQVARARGKPGEYQLAGGRGSIWSPPTPWPARPGWPWANWAAAKPATASCWPRRWTRPPCARPSPIAWWPRTGWSPTPRARSAPAASLRLGKLVVEERLLDKVDPGLVAKALLDQAAREGLSVVPLGDGAQALRRRVAFLRGRDAETWPDLSGHGPAGASARMARAIAGRSLGPGPANRRRPDRARSARWFPGSSTAVSTPRAPARFIAPTGSSFAIDYAADGGPRVDVRVQELFGLTSHPTVGGAPLVLALLSPGHKPIQITKDLPGFWKGSWREVKTEMKGRYPRHVWPDDPATTAPTTRAKPRGT